MAIKALNLNAEIEFQSKHDPDKGKPEATTFKLRCLSPRVLSFLQDKQTVFRKGKTGGPDDFEADFMVNTAAYEVVRHGLVGWTNFLNDEGNPVDFKTQSRNVAGEDLKVCADSTLRVIPLTVARELAEKVNELSSLGGLEAKNSDG